MPAYLFTVDGNGDLFMSKESLDMQLTGVVSKAKAKPADFTGASGVLLHIPGFAGDFLSSKEEFCIELPKPCRQFLAVAKSPENAVGLAKELIESGRLKCI